MTYDELFLSSTPVMVAKKGKAVWRWAVLRASSRSQAALLHTPDSASEVTGHDPNAFIN